MMRTGYKLTGAVLLCLGLLHAGLAQGQTTQAAPTTVHLVSQIDVKDFGAETIRIGDLNGDGGPDLLFVQSVRGPRTITCLTATTISGEILWQTGTPSKQHGQIYSDLPVQIYDWDRDGRNEVLYVRQAKYVEPPNQGNAPRERATRYEGNATMVVLDGRTGKEIWRRRQQKGEWAIGTVPINWFGPGRPEGILVYGQSVFGQAPPRPAVIYDGTGKIVETLPMQYSPGADEKNYTTDYYAFAADVWGDSRDEVILFGSRGACIYANARPLDLPTLYNETLYPGM